MVNRGLSRQIVPAGRLAGRGACGMTSTNTADFSRHSRAASIVSTVRAPARLDGVGAR
jgi:hypothetical protein